ncbi:MAG TPA: hypothetical protein VNX21_07100 [Candidatus Thermoplasmatota archaeon]|nr:hypothetical protein [Candidatus Thermoplasmatota archaeon]
MHARIPLALLTLSLLGSTVLPTAAAQEDETTEVTFYGHIFGFGRDMPMPMNTQFPKGEADYSIGQFVLCGTGLPDTPDVQVVTHPSCGDEFGTNEEWWYTTAGFVQIKEYTEFEYRKLHNERGLTKDTKLDTSKDIRAEFYMSADAHAWSTALCYPGVPNDVPWPVPCWNWDPGYLHQWQVEATIYTGILGEYGGAADEAPDIATAYAEGKLTPLARGISEPIDVQSLEATGNPTVWKFDINLGKPTRNEIKKEESYVIRFKWWSLTPNGPMILPEPIFNINSGEFYPPTVTLPVKGAFTVEMVLPQFVYGKLVLLGIMNTPWGSYDVDHDSVQLEIKNKKTGQLVEPRSIQRLADFSVAHGGHYKPINITWVWDHAGDRLAPGTYQATVTASNYQHSATSATTATFRIRADGTGEVLEVGRSGQATFTEAQLAQAQRGAGGS